jgi:RNA polymerase sigma-70 factor (ECF subfamily)
MTITAQDIEALKANNPIVQQRIFKTLYPILYRISMRYVARTDEAEDCVMRTFLKSFTEIQNVYFENETSFLPWIKRIVINESLMVLRKNSPFKLVPVEDIINQSTDFDFMSELHAEDLLSLITELPDGYRTIFNMFVIEGYTHQEIAQEMGITENTSKSQLHKAKLRLKQMIIRNERRAINE